ncbi:Alpha/beta hydrolase fold-3 [Aspergillus desertorum]
MVAGQSAGGGLAAGVALLARDREGPRICAQLLMCPMLDDQSDSVSCRQYEQTGLWSRASNVMVWSCILGEGHSSDPSMYLAPARAANLVNLPPAYIDVGSAEIYRDEDVAYASKLWEHGVQAELHVWPGGFHAFDAMAPAAELSQKAIKCRTEWVGKMLRSC